jgi:FkbM family methyltransferase
LIQETEHTYANAYGRRVTLHSQPETEQDEWVIHTLRGREHGTFIELGAYDGVYHSNTLCLERDFGWTGWLIEAVPQYAAAAQKVRRAKVVDVVVGPDESQRMFFVGNQWSGLQDFTRPNLMQGHLDHKNPLVPVRTTPLDKLLRSLRVPRVIDYLSLDVEGAEFPILQSYFTMPPVLFRCMTIEVGVDGKTTGKLCELLEPWGYELSHVRAWEAFFIHPQLLEAL